MIKRQAWRKEWKRVIPLWNVIWKVFLESQLRKRSWKKNIPFLLFGKSLFGFYIISFSFSFNRFSFGFVLKLSDLNRQMRTPFETVLNYLFHWLFNARRTLTWFAVTLSQDSIKGLIQEQAVNRLLSLKCNSSLPQSSNGLSSVCRMQKTIKLPRFLYNE